MKASLLFGVALGITLMCTGCVRYYNITTNGGQTITSHGKPRYDKENGVFVFKDVRGEQRQMPAGSISGIAPASDKASTPGFNPQPTR